MDYREKFAILRQRNKLKQEDIAKLCGTSKNNVGHWEHMRHDIPIDSICILCKLYNVSADTILGLTNEIRPLDENSEALKAKVTDIQQGYLFGSISNGKTQTALQLQEILAEKLTEKD